MIDQLAEKINKIYSDNFEKVIIDGYIPADGTYIIVEADSQGNLKETYRTDILIDKKSKIIDRTIDKFNLLCKLDYNSKLIDMNKPIDRKKVIHSNNYLSFFIKKESLIEDKNGKRKLTEEIIDNFYNTLQNPISKYEKKQKSKELYLNVEQEIGEVDKEKISEIKSWIKDNIFNLNIDSSKNYLKIFFLYDEESFEKESKRYLMPNVYNNNDYNIETEGGIIGLPNDNMGLNDKKPYLENKTRKIKIPRLINQEDVLMQKKVFDYLFNLASEGKYNLYINDKEIYALNDKETLNEKFSGLYLRIAKGKEAEIIESDIISNYDPYLNPPFEFKNILDAEYDEKLYKNLKDKVERYNSKLKLYEVEKLVDIIFFNKFLCTNYYSEDISIKDDGIKKAIFIARGKLNNWFRKGNKNNVWNAINKAADLVIKSNLENGYFIKAMNGFNLKYSLKEYLIKGDESMADILMDIKNTLKHKIIEKGEDKIESDREYFFAVGQLTSFLLSKSKGKNKPLSLANPIINAKNDKVIKTKLEQLYMKYNYDLDLVKDIRFKNLYTMIIGYEIEGYINKDLIIAGYLSNNIIYEKKEN